VGTENLSVLATQDTAWEEVSYHKGVLPDELPEVSESKLFVLLVEILATDVDELEAHLLTDFDAVVAVKVGLED